MSKTHTVTSHQFFDLAEFIDSITSVEVAAQAAQSFAFRLDVLLQSSARAIFKSLKTHAQADHGIDTLAEFEIAFSEVEFAEKSFAATGNEVNGHITTIQSLMKLRDSVNEQAQRLTAMTVDWQGVPRVYTPNDVYESFAAKPVLKVSAVTRDRARMTAEAFGQANGLGKDEIAAMLQADMAREQSNLSDLAERLHTQSSAVYLMFDLALGADVGDVAAEFHELPIGVQNQLIQAVRDAISRELDRAKSNRRLNTQEFMSVMTSSMQASKTLDQVLRSPRFVAAENAAKVVERV